MYTNSFFILLLDFMLSMCRPNFANMPASHKKFQEAWSSMFSKPKFCLHFFPWLGSCMSYQPHPPWFNLPNNISYIQYSRIEQNEGLCQPKGSLHCGPQGYDTLPGT